LHPLTAPQLRDLGHELGLSRAAVNQAADEVARLKALHGQVKGALEAAYSDNQEHAKQVCGAGASDWNASGASWHARPCIQSNALRAERHIQSLDLARSCEERPGNHKDPCPWALFPSPSPQIAELESLCAAQQSSLEESEERLRRLADSRDTLRHASLQTKAQLVTAQAQVRRFSGWSDDSHCSGRSEDHLGGTLFVAAAPIQTLAQGGCRWMHSLRRGAPPTPSSPQVGELRAARDDLTSEVARLERSVVALKADLVLRDAR
jgi:hypothetical protein